jgi:hypothetical protein
MPVIERADSYGKRLCIIVRCRSLGKAWSHRVGLPKSQNAMNVWCRQRKMGSHMSRGIVYAAWKCPVVGQRLLSATLRLHLCDGFMECKGSRSLQHVHLYSGKQSSRRWLDGFPLGSDTLRHPQPWVLVPPDLRCCIVPAVPPVGKTRSNEPPD